METGTTDCQMLYTHFRENHVKGEQKSFKNVSKMGSGEMVHEKGEECSKNCKSKGHG